MKRIACFAVAALVTVTACRDVPFETSSPVNTRAAAAGEHPRAITVLSRNMYVGADADAVIGAIASSDPADDFPALITAIQTFQTTDHVARIAAIAGEIARARPHAVGLQEVTVLDIDLNGYGVPLVIHADFLPILMDDLAARGLNYQVAASIRNMDAVPAPGIRLVDYDVLLVDAGRVTVLDAGGQTFATNLGPVAPGVELKRGWVWARTIIDETPYFLANTHLEGSAARFPQLLAAQAAEFAAFLPAHLPVIAIGDFNDVPGSLMHQAMTGQGFVDVWAALRPGDEGPTCCQVPDLSNATSTHARRIDYVFARDVSHPQFDTRSNIAIIGNETTDRIAGPVHPLWPSDHAGIVASLYKVRSSAR